MNTEVLFTYYSFLRVMNQSDFLEFTNLATEDGGPTL